jgi:uncharacterized RDD family membrane protein YckC
MTIAPETDAHRTTRPSGDKWGEDQDRFSTFETCFQFHESEGEYQQIGIAAFLPFFLDPFVVFGLINTERAFILYLQPVLAGKFYHYRFVVFFYGKQVCLLTVIFPAGQQLSPLLALNGIQFGNKTRNQ